VHAEALWIRDEDEGVFWSPVPRPTPAAADYTVRHGFGYTTFECSGHEVAQQVTMFMAHDAPVKLVRIRLENLSDRHRRLSLFSYARWVLGELPGQTARSIVTRHDAEGPALLAMNSERPCYQRHVAFSALVAHPQVDPSQISYTADRRSFLGPYRDLAAPLAVRDGDQLNNRVGMGFDPCAAWQMNIEIPPGGKFETTWMLGEAAEHSQVPTWIERFNTPARVQAALDETVDSWRQTLSTLQVESPAPEIDLMANGWLTYQNLSCRMWGRSAFYQPGGAFGFRDQLQDSSALMMLRPDLTRKQILRHAAQQFVEGDVLHWWHPEPLGRGLRTRFSDDLVWLPSVTAHYIRTTGDSAILDELVPFLSAPPLADGEDEAYLLPSSSGELADLYTHCCRALDRSLTRGPHGLPLMGTGDWNDGMNRVGREGHGESVWMGFFLYRTLGDFLPLCEARGDAERVDAYSAYRADLVQALEGAGWDGAWYRRAYYDDGTPLGSGQDPAADPECRIDAVAQSWAAISGAVPRARAEEALHALDEHLIDEPDRLIRLLAPPFQDTPKDPGYIKGYVAGVRENGGQYTHAACWAVMAMATLGRRDRAARLLSMLSPVTHTATPESVARYRLEPYVVAADVYGAPPHVGRGGWSWYTGSAGWWYRVALESVLGIALEDGRTLVIRPCIPADWPGFRVLYRLPDDETRCEIRVENPEGAGAPVAAQLDGVDLPVQNGAVRATLPSGPGDYRIRVLLG
jgi:cyclic beta-1,2-glucan synthetase